MPTKFPQWKIDRILQLKRLKLEDKVIAERLSTSCKVVWSYCSKAGLTKKRIKQNV